MFLFLTFTGGDLGAGYNKNSEISKILITKGKMLRVRNIFGVNAKKKKKKKELGISELSAAEKPG